MPVMGKGCLILNLVLVAEIVLYLEVGRSIIRCHHIAIVTFNLEVISLSLPNFFLKTETSQHFAF